MITVKYTEYYCDYKKYDHVKSFRDFDELENWIFDQMKRDITDHFAMFFPTPEILKRIGNKPDEVPRIEFHPEIGGATFWIHQMSSQSGIIFSDGVYTSNKKHWSKQVQEWLVHCDERQHNPQFNFVE